jgi:hypothetical protein
METICTNTIRTLSISDFESAFGEDLNDYVVGCIQRRSFQYRNFSHAEKEALLIKIVEKLIGPELVRSGEHRLGQWESGWAENLDLFLQSPADVELIIPKYFNKYGVVRWRGDFICPVSEKFEFYTLAVILDWLFDKYARDAAAIYEFGCGTGHNLLRARNVNSSAVLWGLDWATSSQELLRRIAAAGVDSKIFGSRFDYFDPDYVFSLASDSVVYTVASLEQVGSNWRKFIEYLLQNKPKLCIHVEPVSELLDQSKFIDYLSVEYFKKRNYLNGFLTGLRELEAEGRLTIHRAQRSNVGSLFIEGYSIIVWSPI